MPKMVKIAANPDWRAAGSPEEKAAASAAMTAIKKAGPVEVSYLTAIENIRTSGGMYRILPDVAPVKVKVDTDLNELSMQELKVMMLNLGVKTEKQMARRDVIALIERKLDDVQIVDDEAE